MQRIQFKPNRWDLKDTLPEGAHSFVGFDSVLEREVDKFVAVRKDLSSLVKGDVADALALYARITEDVSRISSNAFMMYSADTKDQNAKAFLDHAEDLQAKTANQTLFFRLWWTALSDPQAEKLLPDGQDDKYVLGSWRKLKPYTLDEKVEQSINIKNTTGFLGWTHHYDKIVSRFLFQVMVSGKPLKESRGSKRPMVQEEVVRLFGSSDWKVREAAYRTLLAKYAENGDILGEIYRTIVRDWRNENITLRGYKSSIASRNLENDVPDEAVESLLKSCRRNADVFQGFFKTKARLIGMKRMNRFHIYAPIVRKEKHVGYEEAVRRVATAFEKFDPKVGRLMLKVFEDGHVDSSPRPGKRGGAYCMSVIPSIAPYLFLNFAGMTRDAYTIAHESGHAIHSQLSSNHSVLTFQPPLVLAETASVFGEMILFDENLRHESDPGERKSILVERISSMYATIGRQAGFVLFELAAHEKVESGATVEDLNREYLSNLKTQFGSAVIVPDEFRWEWTYIPHIFHTPFYCYSYAFGNLLSLALYDMYTKQGKSFVPKYLRILSYGGSESPSKILKREVGVELGSESFWQGGFDVIRRMVQQLKSA